MNLLCDKDVLKALVVVIVAAAFFTRVQNI